MFVDYQNNYHDDTLHTNIIGTHILASGTLTTLPNYFCKPRILDDWYIVYIAKGKGVLTCSDKTYALKEGALFFLFPGVMHAYKTDEIDLLTQYWIGFNGPDIPLLLESNQIRPTSPILYNDSSSVNVTKYFKDIIDSPLSDASNNNLYRTGAFYQLMGLIIKASPANTVASTKNDHLSHMIDKAINYIEVNYRTKLKICDIANYVSLSKSAFFNRFKKEVGLSPGDYITALRLEEARHMIVHTQMPIKTIAERIGYNDPLYFSRVFTTHIGLSPNSYRHKMTAFIPKSGSKGSISL